MILVKASLLFQLSLADQLLEVRCHWLVRKANRNKVVRLPLKQDVSDAILDLLLDGHDLLSIPVVY